MLFMKITFNFNDRSTEIFDGEAKIHAIDVVEKETGTLNKTLQFKLLPTFSLYDSVSVNAGYISAESNSVINYTIVKAYEDENKIKTVQCVQSTNYSLDNMVIDSIKFPDTGQFTGWDKSHSSTFTEWINAIGGDGNAFVFAESGYDDRYTCVDPTKELYLKNRLSVINDYINKAGFSVKTISNTQGGSNSHYLARLGRFVDSQAGISTFNITDNHIIGFERTKNAKNVYSKVIVNTDSGTYTAKDTTLISKIGERTKVVDLGNSLESAYYLQQYADRYLEGISKGLEDVKIKLNPLAFYNSFNKTINEIGVLDKFNYHNKIYYVAEIERHYDNPDKTKITIGA